jgi:hypothetical protein
MRPHWDLKPRETVMLTREDGRKLLGAVFLWRDTVRACFEIRGTRRYFRLSEDGRVNNGVDWQIEGRPRAAWAGVGKE